MTIPIYSAIAIFPQLVNINLRSYILISGPFIQMLKDNENVKKDMAISTES